MTTQITKLGTGPQGRRRETTIAAPPYYFHPERGQGEP